ncbi:hypothetical protein GPALN_010600 [Globodera pallida]|nr:hypothetical protein GPALN_010600 [Globodera pallida]
MLSTILISLCFVGFFCVSNGNAAAAPAELTAEEKAILDTAATQSRNESVEQRANALIKAAENGSEAMKKSADSRIKLMHYRVVNFRRAAEEGSANLTDKAKQYLINVVNINVDEKLSIEERDQKLSAIKPDAEAEKEIKNNRVYIRIHTLIDTGTHFWHMDLDADGYVGLDELRSILLYDLSTKSVVELFSVKNVFKLAESADTNGDGKLSPYEFTGLFDF